MHALFRRSEAAADLKHVHIVEMAVAAESRQWHTSGDDASDRSPRGINVGTDTPRRCYAGSPRTRESPPAYVEFHLFSGHAVDGSADGCVAFLLVEVEFLAGSAIINFYEIVTPVGKVGAGIGRFVTVESGSASYGVVVPYRAAGDGSGVGVESGLEAKGMYMVGDPLHSSGKACRMRLHSPRLIAVTEESVVDIDMVVAGTAETGRYESVGLLHY